MDWQLVEWFYNEMGWRFIRLNGKVPAEPKGWKDNPPTLETLKKHTGNIGVLTGKSLCVLDVDEGGVLPHALTTWTVKTGNGTHYYFRVPEGVTVHNSAGKIAPHVDVRGEGGYVVFPGSVHPETGAIYEWVENQCDLAEVPKWMYEIPSSSQTAKKPAQQKRSGPGYAGAAIKYELAAVRSASEGTRNNQLNTSAFNLGQLVGGGVANRDQIESDLLSAAMDAGLTEHESLTTIRSGIEAGMQQPRTVPEPKQRQTRAVDSRAVVQSDKPTVLVPGYQGDPARPHEQDNFAFATQVLDALPDDIIYIRAGLVGHLDGHVGKRKWVEMRENEMRCVVDNHLRLRNWAKTRDGDMECHFVPCRRDHAGLIAAAATDHDRTRTLTCITPYPVYLPDWTLAKPGWNEGGIYYDEPDDLKGIQPVSEIREFREWFYDLLCDFPFADDASRDNFMALLLTPIVVPAIQGNRPLFVINAPVPRTGKSKLAEEVLGGILTGTKTPAMQLSSSEEERDKRLSALCLSGESVVHLDNLSNRLSSAALASLLTASTIQTRILGQSRMVSVPNNMTIVATGNNVQCSAEIAKRIVPILLQPGNDRPELRTGFRHEDLAAHIRANRRKLLSYLLGAVDHWLDVAGPSGAGRLARTRTFALDYGTLPPFGGFESWRNVVGGILQRARFSKVLVNQLAWQKQSDTETENLEEFVTEWWKQYPGIELKISDLVDMIRDTDIFGSVTEIPNKKGQQIALGRVLAGYVNAPVLGKKICARVLNGSKLYHLKDLKEKEEAV